MFPAQQLGLLVVGALLGFFLSPLFSPQRGAVALGAAITIFLLCFASGPIALVFAVQLGVIAWGIASCVMADAVPALVYELVALDGKTGIAIASDEGAYWYQLEVRNVSEKDVTDLRIVAYLPSFLTGAPTIVRSAKVDSLIAKPGHAVAVHRPVDGPAETISEFSNCAAVEARRILRQGTLCVAFPVRNMPIVKEPEAGYFGVLSVERRHEHYRLEVIDTEAMAITDYRPGRNLLGPPDTGLHVAAYMPISPARFGASGRVDFEVTIG